MIAPTIGLDRRPALASSALEVMANLVRAYADGPEVRHIAVVGNAPLSPSAERASCIDACNLVFRCNSFILDQPGEPAQQGRRVDVVVFNRGLRATPSRTRTTETGST
ncbi:MAG: hypothetical protein WKF73_14435 [Nocardioidaceae bacterium]